MVVLTVIFFIKQNKFKFDAFLSVSWINPLFRLLIFHSFVSTNFLLLMFLFPLSSCYSSKINIDSVVSSLDHFKFTERRDDKCKTEWKLFRYWINSQPAAVERTALTILDFRVKCLYELGFTVSHNSMYIPWPYTKLWMGALSHKLWVTTIRHYCKIGWL